MSEVEVKVTIIVDVADPTTATRKLREMAADFSAEVADEFGLVTAEEIRTAYQDAPGGDDA